MDFLSIGGIIIGIAAVLGGNLLEGGKLLALLNAPAFIIVLGGTIGAVLLQTPWSAIKNLFHMMPWVFSPPHFNSRVMIDKVLNWSRVARKDGLLALDPLLENEADAFIKKGLQLLIDGSHADKVRNALEADNYSVEVRYIQAAHVFESMGGYAPTMGIIGAVMGLIHVMGNLINPAQVGPGIATAFVATIYGIGLANLIFFPIASKLKSVTNQIIQQRELIIEGIVAVAEGEHPSHIEMRLMCYMESTDDLVSINKKPEKIIETKAEPVIETEKPKE